MGFGGGSAVARAWSCGDDFGAFSSCEAAMTIVLGGLDTRRLLLTLIPSPPV